MSAALREMERAHTDLSRRAGRACILAANAQQMHSRTARPLLELARVRRGNAQALMADIKVARRLAGLCSRCGFDQAQADLCQDCRDDLAS